VPPEVEKEISPSAIFGKEIELGGRLKGAVEGNDKRMLQRG
jgi:hypothetical protein